MLHPYQAIKVIQIQDTNALEKGQSTSRLKTKLIAACALQILLVDVESGEVEASWDATQHDSKGAIIHVSMPNPPTHLALATSEDKAIHILSLPSLTHLNKRTMPRRPSGLAWSPDAATTTLLVCDKFGDVYALPLDASSQPNPGAVERPAKRFKPTATNLTVHTEGNRRALELQLREAERLAAAEPQEPPTEGVPPVLGHVSMLTDIVAVRARRRVQGEVYARDFIITADRDEHIRISRGVGQEHVIAGFCLGHTSFVSRLCLIEGARRLVSGGGERELTAWNWLDWVGAQDGPRRSEKIELSDALGTEGRYAVSGLWAPDLALAAGKNTQTPVFAVACEGVPKVQVFTSLQAQSGETPGAAPNEQHSSTVFDLPGNAIDAAWILDDKSQSWKLLVSIDNCHVKSSTSTLRGEPDQSQHRLHLLELTTASNISESELDKQIDASLGDKTAHVEVPQGSKLGELLYGVERLRKTTGKRDEEGEE